MTSKRRFTQVDVLTDEPLRGNPVAVVHDAGGLDEARMRLMARWTNLSETTFLAPPTHPDADYALRIFTPERELPFAGHPTLGSCHAWLRAGGRPKGEHVVQQCGVGLVPIRRDATGGLAFAAPQRQRTGPLEDGEVDLVLRGLGLEDSHVVATQWCDNGPPWEAVLLDSAERVLAVEPDPAVLGDRFVGVLGPHRHGGPADLEVRGFFPVAVGLAEDPVTGSLNAALGQWLTESGRLPDRYVAAQGTALDRAGRIRIEREGATVWVGGGSVSVVDGDVFL